MKLNKTIKILTFLTVGLGLLQVAVFMFFGIQSGTLAKINQTQIKLTEENKTIQKKVNYLTAYSYLEKEAEKMGFKTTLQLQSTNQNIVYLNQEEPFALR